MSISEKWVRHQVEASDHKWRRIRLLSLWIGLSLGLWALILGGLAWVLEIIA
jgi:hypothetical protein